MSVRRFDLEGADPVSTRRRLPTRKQAVTFLKTLLFPGFESPVQEEAYLAEAADRARDPVLKSLLALFFINILLSVALDSGLLIGRTQTTVLWIRGVVVAPLVVVIGLVEKYGGQTLRPSVWRCVLVVLYYLVTLSCLAIDALADGLFDHYLFAHAFTVHVILISPHGLLVQAGLTVLCIVAPFFELLKEVPRDNADLLTIIGKSLLVAVTGLVGISVDLFTVYAQRENFQALRIINQKKDEAERLILAILPEEVVARIYNSGQQNIGTNEPPPVIVDLYEDVTVFACDICNFTALSSAVTAEEVVGMLNALFCEFDDVASRYRLEKIKTLGDAYVCAGGLFSETDNPAAAVCAFALEVQQIIKGHKLGGKVVEMRVGLCTGPIIGGILGTKRFCFDLWGPTVARAFELEQTGVPGKVQVCENTKRAVGSLFTFTPTSADTYLVEGTVVPSLEMGPLTATTTTRIDTVPRKLQALQEDRRLLRAAFSGELGYLLSISVVVYSLGAILLVLGDIVYMRPEKVIPAVVWRVLYNLAMLPAAYFPTTPAVALVLGMLPAISQAILVHWCKDLNGGSCVLLVMSINVCVSCLFLHYDVRMRRAFLFLLAVVQVASTFVYLLDKDVFLMWCTQIYTLLYWYIASFTLTKQDRTLRARVRNEQAISARLAECKYLLDNILPLEIQERLERKRRLLAAEGKKMDVDIADSLDVTVMFCAIYDFEEAAKDLDPLASVELLNRFFDILGGLGPKYGVEKIKSNQHVYMCGGGFAGSDLHGHLRKVARYTLAAKDKLLAWGSGFTPPLRFVFGIASGSAVAGVIGRKKFVYDVWGDTVNLASRMESTAVPNAIQVPAEVGAALKGHGFMLSPPHEVFLKGKGTVLAQNLLGVEDGLDTAVSSARTLPTANLTFNADFESDSAF